MLRGESVNKATGRFDVDVGVDVGVSYVINW